MTSFIELPPEVRQRIFNGLYPEIFPLSEDLGKASTRKDLTSKILKLPLEEIKRCYATYKSIFTTCKQLQSECSNHMAVFHKAFEVAVLIQNKYTAYNKLFNTFLKEKQEYEEKETRQFVSYWFEIRPRFNERSVPYLLDAVLSGFSHELLDNVQPSCRTFTNEVKQDIEAILHLFPESVYCDIGSVSSCHRLAPLAALYINHKQIPDKETFFNFVILLLQKGADPNYTYFPNKTMIDLIRFASLNFQPPLNIEYEGVVYNEKMIKLLRKYGGKTNEELQKATELSKRKTRFTGKQIFYAQEQLPFKKQYLETSVASPL